MKFLVLSFLFASGLLAQTKPVAAQVKAAAGSAPVRLFGFRSDGSSAQVSLGFGVVVTTDPATGSLVVSVDRSILAASNRTYDETPTVGTNPDVWTLAAAPLAGTQEVFANGIKQKSGVDYDLAGSTITFRKACLDFFNGAPVSCLGPAPVVLVSYSK